MVAARRVVVACVAVLVLGAAVAVRAPNDYGAAVEQQQAASSAVSQTQLSQSAQQGASSPYTSVTDLDVVAPSTTDAAVDSVASPRDDTVKTLGGGELHPAQLDTKTDDAFDGQSPLRLDSTGNPLFGDRRDLDAGARALGNVGITSGQTDLDMQRVSTEAPALNTTTKQKEQQQVAPGDTLKATGFSQEDAAKIAERDALAAKERERKQELKQTQGVLDSKEEINQEQVVGSKEAKRVKVLDSTAQVTGKPVRDDPRNGDDPSDEVAVGTKAKSASKEAQRKEDDEFIIEAPSITQGKFQTDAPEYMGGPPPTAPELPEPGDTIHEYGGFEYSGRLEQPQLKLRDVKAKCMSWGNPASVVTFDGRGYTFQGQGGFILYRNKINGERVDVLEMRDPKHHVSRNTAGAFRSANGSTVEIRLVRAAGGAGVRPKILLDGKDISSSAEAEHQLLNGGFRILRDGLLSQLHRLVLAVQALDSRTTMAVSFRTVAGAHHLNVHVEVDSGQYGRTEGLCGLFNFDPRDDLALPGKEQSAVEKPAGATQDEANAAAVELASTFAVGVNDSIMLENEHLSNPITPVAITAKDLGASAEALKEAEHECQGLRLEFFVACVMNRIVGGPGAVAEAVTAEGVALHNSIELTAGALQCLRKDYTVGHWSSWGPCDAKCGRGKAARTRELFVREDRESKRGSYQVDVPCGSIMQHRLCYTECDKPDIWGKCAVFGQGHFVTFDGKLYDYPGVGEYVLYNSDDNREQINVVLTRGENQTHNSTAFAVGASFRFGPDVFSVQVVPTGSVIQARYNGRHVQLKSEPVAVGLFMVRKLGEVTSDGRHTFIAEAKIPGGSTLTASLSGNGNVNHFNVFVELPGERLQETRGMCGSWDFKAENDLTDAAGHKLNNSAYFGWQWRVAPRLSLFVDPVPDASPPTNFNLATPRSLARDDPTYHWSMEHCVGVPSVFRAACMIDALATNSTEVVDDALDAATVVDHERIEAETQAIGCLSRRGSSLGLWTQWSKCSATCGPDGSMSRTRTVIDVSGQVCGELSETKPCLNDPCPVDCTVSEWSPWTQCAATCGNSTKHRVRIVTQKPMYNGRPCPELREEMECVMPACCVVGVWSDWGECRDGYMERTRYVNARHCGHAAERKSCCAVMEWGEWGACEGGLQNRTRVTIPSDCAATVERRECCSVGDWGVWGPCIGGEKKRTRSVIPQSCAPAEEVKDCCSTGEWSEWSTCERGSQKRTRPVFPTNCDHAEQKRACCWTGAWGNWSECSEEGKQTRMREVLGEESCPADNRECCGPHHETHECEFKAPPPVNMIVNLTTNASEGSNTSTAAKPPQQSSCQCCRVARVETPCPCSCRPSGATFYINNARPLRISTIQESLTPTISPIIDSDTVIVQPVTVPRGQLPQGLRVSGVGDGCVGDACQGDREEGVTVLRRQ